MVYLFMVTIAGLVLGWLMRGGCTQEVKSDALVDEACQKELARLKAELEAIKNPVTSEPILLTQANEGGGDDLTRIKGIGKVLEARLNKMGIYHFAQIAAWSPAEAAWIDKHMSFPGRVEREAWVKQAKAFANED